MKTEDISTSMEALMIQTHVPSTNGMLSKAPDRLSTVAPTQSANRGLVTAAVKDPYKVPTPQQVHPVEIIPPSGNINFVIFVY